MLNSILDSIKNSTLNVGKYKTHSQAVIISCYYNPKKSPARLDAFNKFYSTIKHLNHIIIECAIGNGTFELEESINIRRVRTSSTLWHKEALLNNIINSLPIKYDYVFWVDADVIFTNQNWLINGVNALKNGANIIQPFAHYKKAFVCTDLFGKQISVMPTNHSIDRFMERYHYVDHFCNIPTRESAINKMRELFNSSKQKTNLQYIERASHRNRPKDMVAWGNKNFTFIVNTVTLYIATFELSGKLSIYNRRD